MTAELREFNEEGIRQFRDYFSRIKNNDIDQDFSGLLTDERYTSIISSDTVLEPQLSSSKRDAAEYLHKIIDPLPIENKFYNQGLWTWLAAFYFDSVCPVSETGTRSVGSEERYVLIPGRVIYRHLLAGPVQIFDAYGSTSRILLSGDVTVMGDYIEQLAGRIYITSSRGNVQAIDMLYWDSEKNLPIKGATSRKKPGNIRRFADIINQFRLTYDLTSMNGFEIVALLPKEFDKYKQNITAYLFE